MTPTAVVAYLALFATVGFLFVLASLLLGKLLRAHNPTPLKVETYECGEPTVGPGSVQFDLRFYVVALVFLIFEVEVAFFFPPATVFGKAVRSLAGQHQVQEKGSQPVFEAVEGHDASSLSEATVPAPSASRTLALAAMLDLGVFFAVLLVGFAYVWSRGDLNWVRAIHDPTTAIRTEAMSMGPRG